MPRLAWIVAIVAFITIPAVAQTGIPDVRGTWKGNSETVVLGGNPHHPDSQAKEPRFTSAAFTLTIDKQEGRRFYGKFSSARATETVVAIISRSGAIYMVDDDGYDVGAMLAPDRMELCYLHLSPGSQIASCTEFVKQP
jgi:hypothetical protein